MATRHPLSLSPLTDRQRIDSVINAIDKFDLTTANAWSDLRALSSNTEFDELQPNLDGIFERSDGVVEIVGSAYVTLQYGGKKDHVEMTEAYPAKIIGYFENETFKIEEVTVDTSSFYA